MTTRTRLSILTAVCIGAVPLWSQSDQPKGQLTARELFYAGREQAAKSKPAAHHAPANKPVAQASVRAAKTTISPDNPAIAPPVTPSPHQEVVQASYSNVPLGLRYTVLKRSGDRSVEVAPGSVFHSGDRIQLAVEVNDSGYLYIVTQGSSGTWEVLFPSPKIEGGDNRVESRRRYVVPQGYVFSFAGQPGVEKLFIIFSRRPESEIDRLIYSLQGDKPAPAARPEKEPSTAPQVLLASTPLNNALVDQFRDLYSRDLIIEKAGDEPAAHESSDQGVYVVNPKGAADSRVVADIRFTHE